MNEFSFEVNQQALDVVRNAKLQANFEECKVALTEMLAPYKTMIIQEADLPQAKADRARIRKVASRIDEARKEVKRIYTEPLKQFEERCKELTAICGEADANIDRQVKAFDQRRKDEKVAELRSFFNGKVGEASEFLHFDAIFNPRWENVTYSVEAAHSDILREISSCISAVNAIRTIHSPFETTLLDLYRQNHNLAECMNKHEQLLRLREIEEKRKEAQEQFEAAQKAAAERQALESSSVQEQVKDAEQRETDTPEDTPVIGVDLAEKPAETIFTLDFRVHVKKDQMLALKKFLTDAGIKYEPVPRG